MARVENVVTVDGCDEMLRAPLAPSLQMPCAGLLAAPAPVGALLQAAHAFSVEGSV